MREDLKTKEGFTLVELMVAMAIIAALIGMSVFGINLVQRSQRNTERRSALNNLNLAVRNHMIDNNVYPTLTGTTDKVTFFTDRVEIDGEKVVELKGAAKANSDSTQESHSGGSRYCYISNGSTFTIGVELEGTSKNFVLGSDGGSTTCTTYITPNP